MRAGSPYSQSLRIVALYALVSAGWILFSDRLAGALTQDPDTLLLVSTLKGWFFVAVTTLLLLLTVRRQLVRTTATANARADAEAARARAEAQRALAREEALAAAQRLTLATRSAHIGTWEWEPATDRVLGDEQLYAIYAYRPGEVPATLSAWMERVHPDDRAGLRTKVQAVIAGQQDYHAQYRLVWPDKQIRYVEAHALVKRARDGHSLRLLGVNWDVTERVRTEQRYRLLADHVGDVLWTIDLDTGCYTYVSPSITRLRGCTAAELIGKPLAEGLTPSTQALVNELLPARLQAFLAGDPAAVTQTNELEQYHRNGSTIWTETVTTFLRKEQGGVEVLGVTHDISKRRAAEQALRASTARLSHAEEIAGIGHWSLQLDTATVEGSDNAARIYGLPLRLPCPFAQIQAATLPEYRAQNSDALRALVAGERPYDLTYTIRRADSGTLVILHSRAEYDPATRTVFGTFQDITQREQTLAALRASEAKLRLLVGNAPVILVQIGADGLFRMAEGSCLAKLGLRPGELVGRSAFEVYRDRPALCALIRAGLAGRPVHDQVQVGATWFEIFYNPMADATGQITDLIGLAIDITERKHVEARLRLESAALAAADHAIAITDARGLVEWINPAFTRLTGFAVEETVGHDLGKLVQSGQQTEDFYRQLWTTILAGDTWHGELVNRRKDGSLVDVEETITPVRDDRGVIAHYIAVKQDITERRRLQEQALRAQRLDSVGRLAGGIAHDLNNILAPILMAPSVLRDGLTDPAALEILDSIETSANRGAAIIRQLLTFSRGGGAGERLPVQLLPIVRDMVTMIRETFPKNIVTRTDLAAEPWLAVGDATQLHQVLMNLCVNSRDAMPAGGTLTLTLENVELDADAVAGHPGAGPGPHVLLGVFDTGTGIAADHLDKVFDPFFTTKEVGKGTGLGLATVLGIVQAHHGFVQIGSKPGAGTQVRVYLPAVPSASTSTAEAGAGPLPLGHGELVLLVDDEDNVRRITRRILEQQGYRVLAASDGAEALARFQQHRATIRVVFTDLLMPFLDGPGLIQAVRQIDPAMRIIAVSGHAAEPDQERPATIDAFLAKPYSRQQLLQTVASVLASARS